MFKFSFKNIPESYSDEELFPLIAALNFGSLTDKESKLGRPIICDICGSVFTDISKFSEQEGDLFTNFCPYCGSQKVIKKEIYQEALGILTKPDATEMNQADLAFLLEEISAKKADALDQLELKGKISEFPINVAVIDISGSMNYGKLDAVKHALVQNVNKITAQSPQTRFILIPFDSNVEVFFNPKKPILFKDGPTFFKLEKMAQQITSLMKEVEIDSLEQSHENWTDYIKRMQVKGMTALGPALYLGTQAIINLLGKSKSKSGGKLLLLTDGLANVGIGAVENDLNPDGESARFYHKISEICVKHNIIVDMIGVRDQGGGNSVALNIIGQVTDYTGGQMLFITADQVEAAFGDLRGTNFVARNAILRVFAPDFIQLGEIQGAYTIDDIASKVHGEDIKIGGFSQDREIYVKFKPVSGKISTPVVPIQIQLEYLDEQGNKKMRTLERQIKVVQKKEEFEKDFDPQIATAYELSKASLLRSKGRSKLAKSMARKSRTRNISLQKSYNKNVEEINALVADEEEEWDEEDAAMENVADKLSYQAAFGQERYRASYDAKLKRMKKKGNK